MCGEFGEVTVIIGLVINFLAFVSPLCAFRDTSTYSILKATLIWQFLQVGVLKLLQDLMSFSSIENAECGDGALLIGEREESLLSGWNLDGFVQEGSLSCRLEADV